MFGRRKREETARVDEAREVKRRELFEQLAKRPETVCPFLGLATDRAGYQPEPNGEHRCYAFGDPAPLSDEQQRHVCLERGYSNCPRYLRGVLVIPTEELEALRRPQPHVPPPPPPAARPVAEGGGGRRRWLVLLPVLVVLMAALGGGGWYLLSRSGVLLPSASATPSASPTESAQISVLPTPTETPLPTPTTGDTFIGYEVGVGTQTYTLYQIDDAGNIIGSVGIGFNSSHATVQPVTAPNGLRYWETLDGPLAGDSYIHGRSGPFEIRKVFRATDGSRRAEILPEDQL